MKGRGSFLLWVLIAFLIAVTAALMLNHDAGVTLGLPNGEFGELAYLVAILVFLSSALFVRTAKPLQVLRDIVSWALIGVIVILGYTYRTELVGVGGRFLGVLAPGLPVPGHLAGLDEPDAVVVTRGGRGHFAVRGLVDGQPVNFLVDTGASFVTLTAEEAARLGQDLAELRFVMPIRTANGLIEAAPITIDRLAVGTIEREGVRALVAPPGSLSQSLLGLSFLDTLAAYTVAGDRLLLTP